MRLEGYEIVGELIDADSLAPEQVPRFLAHDADGTLLELATVYVREHERAHALQRFAAARALSRAWLPKLVALEGDPAVRTQMVVVTEHKRRITLAQCAKASEDGLAVPLVCTLACAVARAVAELHSEGVVHGNVNGWTIAIDGEGAMMLDAPRMVRVPDARDDIDALVRTMCVLIGAMSTSEMSPLSSFEGETDLDMDDQHVDLETVPQEIVTPADVLAGKRSDVPHELIDVLRADHDSAHAFADALARALPWAQ